MSNTVSISIPTYNRAHLVVKAIRSALAQSYAQIEIVVVDNASTDDTWSILNSFKDDRLRLYRNSTNLGMWLNIDRCLELSKGTWFILLSSDDWLHPDMVTRCVNLSKEGNDVVLVHTGVNYITEDGSILASVAPLQSTIYSGNEFFQRFWNWAFWEQRFHLPMAFSGTMFNRQLLLDSGGFNGVIGGPADVGAMLLVALQGSVGYVAEPLVNVLVHRANATTEIISSSESLKGLYKLVEYTFSHPWIHNMPALKRSYRRARFSCAVRTVANLLGARMYLAVTRSDVMKVYFECLRHEPLLTVYPWFWWRVLLSLLSPALLHKARNVWLRIK